MQTTRPVPGGGTASWRQPLSFDGVKNIEIERKFLVPSLAAVQPGTGNSEAGGPPLGKGVLIVQGYLLNKSDHSLRIRFADESATLTIKRPLEGASRSEHEHPISSKEFGLQLLRMCDGRTVRKIRYKIAWGRHLWEIDCFRDRNEGLVMAEVELESPDEEIQVPPWCDNEVTDDSRYYNEYLAKHPYASWE